MGKTLAAEHQREVASLRTLADERQQEVIAARAELARVRASADRKVEKFESEDSDDAPSQPSKFGWKHRGSKDQRLLHLNPRLGEMEEEPLKVQKEEAGEKVETKPSSREKGIGEANADVAFEWKLQ